MKLCIRKYMPIQLSRFSSMKRHEGTAELEIIWDIWRLQWVQSHLFGVHTVVSPHWHRSVSCWQSWPVWLRWVFCCNSSRLRSIFLTCQIFDSLMIGKILQWSSVLQRLISIVSLWPNLVITFMSHRKIMLWLIVLDPCRGWTPDL